MAVLNLSVDFHSMSFAFRGRAGEPPRRFSPAGSPLPRTPAGVSRIPLQSTDCVNSTFSFNTAILILPVFIEGYLVLYLVKLKEEWKGAS